MKIVINKNVLNNILDMATSIIQENSINPILSNILIESSVDENKVVFTFSNESISVKYTLNEKVQVEKKGRILVKAKTFKGIISKLPNDDIYIERIDNTLKINNSTFDANINLLDDTMYIDINFNCDNSTSFEMNNVTISEILKKLNHCLVARADKTSVINGIYFDNTSEKGIINFVATDSYKVALLKKPFQANEFKIVVDVDFLNFINQFSRNDEEIKFEIQNNRLFAKWKNVIAVSKLILGSYPNVYSIFNTDNQQTNEFIINAKDLYNVIDRGIYMVSSDKTPATTISVYKDYLDAMFKSVEIGSSYEKIKIKDAKNENHYKFLMNARFLATTLKAFDDHDIRVIFTDPNKPVIFADIIEKDFIQLVLPMRSF